MKASPQKPERYIYKIIGHVGLAAFSILIILALLPKRSQAAGIMMDKTTGPVQEHRVQRDVPMSMKTSALFTSYQYLPTLLENYPPIWQQSIGTAFWQFRTPHLCADSWYAGAFISGIWQSTDHARSWSPVATLGTFAFPVIPNPNNCAEVFVSDWGAGVYRVVNGTLTQINAGLGTPYVYGLALDGSTLYAGTDLLGVYKTEIGVIDWQPVNNGISDKRIRFTAAQGSEIFAGSRNCLFYISINQAASWSTETVINDTNCPAEAQVWTVLRVNQTLYAGLGNDGGLYYKENTWQPVPGIPARTIFGLAFDQANHDLYVSTYGEGIYRCRVEPNSGVPTDCHAYNLGLNIFSLYTRELNIGTVAGERLLVAGSDNGIWYLSLLP